MRQDQRIEGMFECINDLMKEDVECRNRQMALSTYQVIPISSKVGVIEWVDNAVEFLNFVQVQADRMKW